MIADALVPVFLLILAGFGLSRFAFRGDYFWPDVERLTYFLLFPALLIYRLTFADFAEAPVGKIAIAILIPISVVSLGLYLLKNRLSVDASSFTSIFQGSIRFNTYVGLAGANALFGDAGLVLAAVIAAMLIPLVNILCILSFPLSGVDTHMHPRELVKGVMSNPLIIGCVVGITLNLTGIGLASWAGATLSIFSAAALPLGLLAVGAGVRLTGLPNGFRSIGLSCATRFFVLPVLTLALCIYLDLDFTTRQILVLFAALPTASSAFILARQLGGDTDLMANTITIQTLMAFLAIPIWLSVSTWLT